MRGSTFSQNSSLTVHGLVHAIIALCLLSVPLTASLLGFYRTILACFRIRTKYAPMQPAKSTLTAISISVFLEQQLPLALAHLSGSAYVLIDRRISHVFHGAGTANFCV